MSLAEDLQRALEQLCVRREQEDWDREDLGGGSGDMTENEDGNPIDVQERGWCLCASAELVSSTSLLLHVDIRDATHLMRG